MSNSIDVRCARIPQVRVVHPVLLVETMTDYALARSLATLRFLVCSFRVPLRFMVIVPRARKTHNYVIFDRG